MKTNISFYNTHNNMSTLIRYVHNFNPVEEPTREILDYYHGTCVCCTQITELPIDDWCVGSYYKLWVFFLSVMTRSPFDAISTFGSKTTTMSTDPVSGNTRSSRAVRKPMAERNAIIIFPTAIPTYMCVGITCSIIIRLICEFDIFFVFVKYVVVYYISAQTRKTSIFRNDVICIMTSATVFFFSINKLLYCRI